MISDLTCCNCRIEGNERGRRWKRGSEDGVAARRGYFAGGNGFIGFGYFVGKGAECGLLSLSNSRCFNIESQYHIPPLKHIVCIEVQQQHLYARSKSGTYIESMRQTVSVSFHFAKLSAGFRRQFSDRIVNKDAQQLSVGFECSHSAVIGWLREGFCTDICRFNIHSFKYRCKFYYDFHFI